MLVRNLLPVSFKLEFRAGFRRVTACAIAFDLCNWAVRFHRVGYVVFPRTVTLLAVYVLHSGPPARRRCYDYLLMSARVARKTTRVEIGRPGHERACRARVVARVPFDVLRHVALGAGR